MENLYKSQSSFLKESFSKKPLDLTSPEVIKKFFASKEEALDVLDIIRQVKNPVQIGIIGSRANLEHPPLFKDIKSFKSYHTEKAKNDLPDYLAGEGLSMEDYRLAEKYLKEGFNEGYKHGKKYPEPIVRLLVRDIDLKINSRDNNFRGGPRIGKRTNVTLDIDTISTFPDAILIKY